MLIACLYLLNSCNRPAGSQRSLDDPEGLCYNMSTERALPIDGLLPPVRYEKVTAKFGSYGRLLFLHNLDNQIGKTNKYETKLT